MEGDVSGKRAKELRRETRQELAQMLGHQPMHREWRRYYRWRKRLWARTPRDVRGEKQLATGHVVRGRR
jgi:hypothetical protein